MKTKHKGEIIMKFIDVLKRLFGFGKFCETCGKKYQDNDKNWKEYATGSYSQGISHYWLCPFCKD